MVSFTLQILKNHDEECPTSALPSEVAQELPVIFVDHFISEEEDSNSCPENDDGEDGVSIAAVRDNDLTFNDSIRILSDIIKISIPLLLVQMERRESTDQ